MSNMSPVFPNALHLRHIAQSFSCALANSLVRIHENCELYHLIKIHFLCTAIIFQLDTKVRHCQVVQCGTICGSSFAIFRWNGFHQCFWGWGKAVLGGPCLSLLIRYTNHGNTAWVSHNRAVVHQLRPSCLQQSIVLWLYLRQSWQNCVSFYVFSSSHALSFGWPALFGALQLLQYRFAWSCWFSDSIVYMFTLHTAVTLRGNCLCRCSLFYQ